MNIRRNWRVMFHLMTSTRFPDSSALRLYTRLRHATASKLQAAAVAVESTLSCWAPWVGVPVAPGAELGASAALES